MNSDSFAKRDLQLKVSYASSPLCTLSPMKRTFDSLKKALHYQFKRPRTLWSQQPPTLALCSIKRAVKTKELYVLSKEPYIVGSKEPYFIGSKEPLQFCQRYPCVLSNELSSKELNILSKEPCTLLKEPSKMFCSSCQQVALCSIQKAVHSLKRAV